MSKTGKNFLKGATILAAGSFIAKFLGMFLKFPLNRILGGFGMGLYSNAYPIYTFLLSLSVIGLPVAISKMVSERVSRGYYDGAYKVFKVSLTALAIIGAVFSLIMIFGANIFIYIFEWHPDTYYSMMGLSLAPLFVCIMSSFKGFFQGMQNMTPPSGAQIVESFTRVIIGLVLATYFAKTLGNIAMGAAGATFGATAGAIAGSLFLFICFLFNKKKVNEKIKKQQSKSTETNKEILKILAMIAIPITLASLVTSSMNMINAGTISKCLGWINYSEELATTLWGYLSGRAQTLISIPLVLSSALAASLVPTITQAHVNNERKEIRDKTYLTLKIVFMIALPCVVGFMVLAEPIITLLFGSPEGTKMLQLLCVTILTTMISTTLQSVLQGIGQLRTPVINLGIGCIIKLILNLILIPIKSLNIFGAIIGTIVADLVVATLDYMAVRKNIGSDRTLLKNFAKTAASAVIMGVVTFGSFTLFSGLVGSKIATIIAIVFSAGAYFAMIYSSKLFNFEEIKSVVGR